MKLFSLQHNTNGARDSILCSIKQVVLKTGTSSKIKVLYRETGLYYESTNVLLKLMTKLQFITLLTFVLISLTCLINSHRYHGYYRYHRYNPRHYHRFYSHPYYGYYPYHHAYRFGIHNHNPPNTVLDIFENPRFSNLTSLIDQAELRETLSREGPFTIFAPTNKAFERLPQETLQKVASDNDVLKRVLQYHVISGRKVSLYDLRNGQELETLLSDEPPLVIKFFHGRHPTVNDKRVLKGNLYAKNGVVHVIDEVLIPPSVADEMNPSREP
ncbi:stabilin-2-like [Tachypleus tridentatus]|uniref:stabilin-2-like n=1 Tax=Tachypleus tridentatus TaxID=6853 RepID=UPI003FD6B9BD